MNFQATNSKLRLLFAEGSDNIHSLYLQSNLLYFILGKPDNAEE